MRSLFALLSVLIAAPAFAQPPSANGGGVQMLPVCKPLHQDKAVNNAVSISVPLPTQSNQTTYICGWDWTVAENTTGTAQTNVLWTTTNLNGLASEYSIAATPSALVSGAYYPSFAIQAQVANQPVTFTSPAAATNAAYSLNVYYFYGPVLP